MDILLPHNTLVIMWPPTQEEWRHEVCSPDIPSPDILSASSPLDLRAQRTAGEIGIGGLQHFSTCRSVEAFSASFTSIPAGDQA